MTSQDLDIADARGEERPLPNGIAENRPRKEANEAGEQQAVPKLEGFRQEPTEDPGQQHQKQQWCPRRWKPLKIDGGQECNGDADPKDPEEGEQELSRSRHALCTKRRRRCMKLPGGFRFD
jgi:hypothetical protein